MELLWECMHDITMVLLMDMVVINIINEYGYDKIII